MDRIRSRFALLAAAGLLAACDTPVSLVDHPEPGGVVIYDAASGAVLAQVVGENTAFPAPLNLTAGEVRQVQIRFLHADAPNDLSRAFAPDTDEGESTVVTTANAAVVSYSAQGGQERFQAGTAGQTTVTIALWHVNHIEWSSGPLTINVQ